MKYGAVAGTLMTLSAITFADTANSAEMPWYVGLSGDLTWIQDSDVKDSAGQIEYDLGGGGNIAFGYNISRYLRAELEGGYHVVDLDTVTSGAGVTTDPSKNIKIATIMVNAYYDIANTTNFTPYLGVGIGDAYLNLPRTSGLGNADNNANEFAYQFMAGVSYTPMTMPATDWSIGYRYLGVFEPDFDNITLESLNTHSVEVAFKYHF